ncbi:MAG: hypothetical protein U1F71_02595 [Verrucomicrobiaceae bacterium]
MRLLASLLCLLLPSCIHIFTTRHEYTATRTAPTVGGSAFRAEFIPQDKKSSVTLSAMVVGGALVSEIGPFLLRLHAFGKPGDQRWFEIKRMRITSKDGFSAPMEPRGFVGRPDFTATKNPAVTRASLLFGPHITLDARKQHDITLELDVSVMRRSGLATGSLSIPMALTKTSRRESIFICTEIWRDLRKHETMDDLPQAFPPPPESP